MKPIYRMLLLCIVVLCCIAPIQAQDTLVDLFSHPDCENACFLGIEPGITTGSEVETILDATNIEYEIIYYERKPLVGYFLNGVTLSPFILDDSNAVGILTFNDVVVDISVALSGVTASDILTSFGAPVTIHNRTDRYTFTYPDDGLFVDVDAADAVRVEAVYLRTPEVLWEWIQGTSLPLLQPCTEPANLCSIELAPFTRQTPYEFAIVQPNPDGSAIVGVANNGLLRIWDTDTTNVLLEIRPQSGFPPALDIAWSPDGTRIATVGGDPILRIWCVDFTEEPTCTPGELLAAVEGHLDPLISVAWSNDNRIATGGQIEPLNVRIWDATNNFQSLHTIPGPFSNDLAWDESSGLLYSASWYGGISVIDTESETYTFLGPDILALAMAISPDGTRIAVVTDMFLDTEQAFVYILDINDGSEIAVRTVDGTSLHAVTWSPDGVFLAYVSRSGTVYIWDMEYDTVVTVPVNKDFVATVDIGWTETTGLVYPISNGAIRGIPTVLPVANAGQDQTLSDADGDGQEVVTLDGSASQRQSETIVRYLWFEDDTLIATGANPIVTFEVGTHYVTLQVTSDDGLLDTDEVVITVHENE